MRSWRAAAVLALLAGGAVVLARRRLVVITVVGGSMAPTYHPGDRVLLLRTSRVRRGRVVVARPAVPLARYAPEGTERLRPVHRPSRRGTTWATLGTDLVIKRVAAVPGDHVPPSVRAVVADATVPAGKLVLLGDGRASADSRAWGFSAIDDVLGVVVAELRRAPTPDQAAAQGGQPAASPPVAVGPRPAQVGWCVRGRRGR
jgi:signal peptidase I